MIAAVSDCLKEEPQCLGFAREVRISRKARWDLWMLSRKSAAVAEVVVALNQRE